MEARDGWHRRLCECAYLWLVGGASCQADLCATCLFIGLLPCACQVAHLCRFSSREKGDREGAGHKCFWSSGVQFYLQMAIHLVQIQLQKQ